MKHIEVSRKIELSKPATAAELKKILLERLEKAIDIEAVGDGLDAFSFSGTTGAPAGMTRHARVDFDVQIMIEDRTARIIISGFSRMARSLILFYIAAFFAILLIGLLPGSFDTSAATSDAGDMLVLLILGIFITVDVGKKLAEPRDFLETALQSMATSFG